MKPLTRSARPALGPIEQKLAHDRHIKAAQYCVLASKCHEEAALHFTGGDFRAASSQSQLASELIGCAIVESQRL